MPRRIFPLTRNWLYKDEAVSGCIERDFNDESFDRISLPHSNRTFPWHSFDDSEYQFDSVYRRHFTLPEELRGGRLFVDFEGVMAVASVAINGERLGQHRGGYTPFSFELTHCVDWDEDNVLAVEVDSTERADIPPFGGRVDYLTFGGIYREVALRAVPTTFIADVFAKPADVLSSPRLELSCRLDDGDVYDEPLELEVEVRDGGRSLATSVREIDSGTREVSFDLPLRNSGEIELWDIDHPKLYETVARLYRGDECIDEYTVRTGFREARFTGDGFYLNGRRLELRGLNRHQTYPYVGPAMPARVQRRDALILKEELKCNIVRTSHYPQSRHFLDCCDEIGLLVFEEMPGWQHIGDQRWQDVACRNVEEMIRRDRNRPSIILWGVRINESPDDHDFYTRTNAIAHTLDDSRQTGGVRNFFDSELLEDVFTVNDFDPDRIRPPHHPRYLVTEFVGHTFPTKRTDNVERVQEHALRYAQTHERIVADKGIAGGIGWCAFDYNTHADFGSGDRVCYHGVCDIFRVPKAPASFYRSQCEPSEEVVLEPCFHWAIGDRSGSTGPGTGVIFSNCDRLVFYVGDERREELTPDRENFGHLPYPPFFARQLGSLWGQRWRDLRIDGYVGAEKVVSKRMSARGVDARFYAQADDHILDCDGADATRVVLRVTDEYDAPRPFATGAIALTVDGPGEVVGENPFALVGGVGAVWVRAREQPGSVVLRATHPVLGTRVVEIEVTAAPDEVC